MTKKLLNLLGVLAMSRSAVNFVLKAILLFKVIKFFQKNHCIHSLFMLMYFLLYGPPYELG